MADKRSTTSVENGKKGGRKPKQSTLLAEKARDYIAKRLDKELGPIVDKAIMQAKDGDHKAREWLSERGWGKVVQTINTEDEDGKKMPITGITINQPNEGKKS